jgi:alkanesulfonate monooxygenase SsuD/methylene tetrahydromethanopterin reductase-like flavin-dependent oxidoreductase (luciferase family)
MLRMAGRVADGVMMSDVTLPRIAESMVELRKGLAARTVQPEYFPVSNLYAWHVQADPAAARAEARAKLFVRGMLEHWYIAPFLDADECAIVEERFPAFAKAYIAGSAHVDGVADALLDKLVDNLTWTGAPADIDRFIDEMAAFEAAGVTEMAVRLYGQPEESIRLLAERVLPAFR